MARFRYARPPQRFGFYIPCHSLAERKDRFHIYTKSKPFLCLQAEGQSSGVRLYFVPLEPYFPLWGQTTRILSSSPPKRDCGSKRVIRVCQEVDYY